MHKILISLVVGLLTFGLLVADADARRMGGGKSLGFQRPEMGRWGTPPAAAPFRAQPSPAVPRPAPSPRTSRWLGPLAGLAAGGLLAALLFGDAFHGLQAFDFILIALLGLGVYFIVRAMRRSSAPQPSRGPMVYAGNTAAGRTVRAPEIGGGVRGAAPAADRQRPDWFDEQGFLQAAKGHFSRLQAAWDTGDLNEIREYTTPELFAELARERRELGDERQYTQVVSLDAELADFVTEGDKVIASVRFSGLIREERDGEPKPFNEIWHVERSLFQSGANWYVSGIQQV